MFSTLTQNSILYILETKDSPKLTTGTVINVSIPRPQFATFGQQMDLVVDITATVGGERREFKRIPSNQSVANFGPDAFVLADSRDAITSHISAALQNSRNIVDSVDRHKQLAAGYERLLEELDPVLKKDKEKDKAIQTLQDELREMKQMIESMAMSKGENAKTKTI
jgi:hypothetical protein